jgi:hypothetical protein
VEDSANLMKLIGSMESVETSFKREKLMHAKGPWEYDLTKSVTKDGKVIAIRKADEVIAFSTIENAPLIGAAPKMLKALKHILSDAEWVISRMRESDWDSAESIIMQSHYDIARETISEVEGE